MEPADLVCVWSYKCWYLIGVCHHKWPSLNLWTSLFEFTCKRSMRLLPPTFISTKKGNQVRLRYRSTGFITSGKIAYKVKSVNYWLVLFISLISFAYRPHFTLKQKWAFPQHTGVFILTGRATFWFLTMWPMTAPCPRFWLSFSRCRGCFCSSPGWSPGPRAGSELGGDWLSAGLLCVVSSMV